MSLWSEKKVLKITLEIAKAFVQESFVENVMKVSSLQTSLSRRRRMMYEQDEYSHRVTETKFCDDEMIVFPYPQNCKIMELNFI